MPFSLTLPEETHLEICILVYKDTITYIHVFEKVHLFDKASIVLV